MKSMQKILYPFLLYSSVSVTMASGTIDLSGYYKNFSVVLVPPGIKDAPSLYGKDSPLGLVNNRLRLNSSFDFNQAISFSLAYDLSPRIQDPSFFEQQYFISEINPYSYRVTNLHSRLYPAKSEYVKSFVLFQNLDRAFVKVKTDWADLDIGRQAIAWGSSRVINPTDVIAPFTFEELDTEDRIGVDAIRLRIPVGFMGEMDAGFIGGKEMHLKNSAWYLRHKFYTAKTDVSILLLDFQGHVLAGLDLARSIGGAGAWAEFAYVAAEGIKNLWRNKTVNYIRATIGADYNFNSKAYGFLEYHFSSAGSAEPEQYLTMFKNAAISKGGIYLMGQHYLVPGITYQVLPLLIASEQFLMNLVDRSLFMAPKLEYNISENIYLSVGAFMSLGKQPKLLLESGVWPPMVLQSEFGSYPDMYFTSFVFYF